MAVLGTSNLPSLLAALFIQVLFPKEEGQVFVPSPSHIGASWAGLCHHLCSWPRLFSLLFSLLEATPLSAWRAAKPKPD